jgi:signal transduction histidine kinase/phage shock protein PspC (stress-responsive transcriptional regulator)
VSRAWPHRWRFHPPRDVLRAPVTRSRTDRVIAGVAAGISDRLGLDPALVRIAFVVLTVAGGSGVLLYVAGWLLLPQEPGGRSIAQGALQDRRDLAQAAAVGVLVLGSLLLLRTLGLWFSDNLIWPTALSAAGLALIWRRADEQDRAAVSRVASRLAGSQPLDLRARRIVILRVVVGVGLVVAGVGAFLAVNHAFAAFREGLIGTIGIVAGTTLIFGPWVWRLASDLTEERRERIRTQERADMARHVHDSVLQTLALIQRQAEDPRAVVSLSRRQERELRGWLYGGLTPAPDGLSFRAALENAVAEVEEVHGITVDAVIVGDCPMDDSLAALVAASKEALVNAAKWSGCRAASGYAEVEPNRVSVFIRDRGVGFDPDTVAPDRRGIAESIRARMRDHRGSATIRSEPGAGTEVELTITRPAA